MKKSRTNITGIASISLIILGLMTACEFDEAEPNDNDNGRITTVDFSPFIELNTLGGTVSFSNAISNDGTVVGASNMEDGSRLAIVASPNIEVGIPSSTFSESEFLDIDPDQPLSVGFGINDQGFSRPVLLIDSDRIVELEMGDQGDTGGEAMAVGNGYVAGVGAVPFTGNNLPILWDASPSGNIIMCLDSTDTYDINQIYYVDYVDAISSTVVLGSTNDTRITGTGTGYMWASRAWTALTTSEYTNIIPHDINNQGQIAVTIYDANGNNLPAIYQGGEVTLLDLPDGFTSGSADAINDNGEVVGRAFGSPSFSVTSVYWEPSGEPTDLNDFLSASADDLDALGYDPYIMTAEDINENGDITGEGYFNINLIDDGAFTDRQREGYLLPGDAL